MHRATRCLQEGVELVLSKFPETLQVELGVAAMGVESPEGTFIQTGSQLQRLRSATDLTGERCSSEGRGGRSDQGRGKRSVTGRRWGRAPAEVRQQCRWGSLLAVLKVRTHMLT